MASHVQSQRRQSDRSPGVLHRASPGALPESPAVTRHETALYDARWRVLSGFAFLTLGLILILMFISDSFYVRSIEASGLIYQTKEEVFAFSGIADYHIFWLDPQRIRANILRSALAADVTVELGWPPTLIAVQIQERQPAILWSESGGEVWIDLQGRVMPARAEIPGLLRVTVEAGGTVLLGRQNLDKDTVLGALQMREILPQGIRLDYNSTYGLGWTNERGWQVWVGSGAGMSEKMIIYDFLFDNLTGRGIEVEEVNIANPDAPFYRILGER